MIRPFRFALALLIAAGALPAAAASFKERADLLGLQGHKALYNIKLVQTHSGSQVVNISGQMFYEWQPTCEAWISNHHFNILYEYADSAPMQIASDFSTYEPFDGQSLSFTSQRKREGEVFEELRGLATVDPLKGHAGRAVYSLPPDLAFELTPGSVFPMGHTLKLGEQIKAGKKFFNAVLFDGSDEEGPVEVNAFIGKALGAKAAPDNASVDKALLAAPAHRIRMAFFPLEAEKESSDYEMSLDWHENGVISDIVIEYEDFTIRQDLVALEPVGNNCEAKNLNP